MFAFLESIINYYPTGYSIRGLAMKNKIGFVIPFIAAIVLIWLVIDAVRTKPVICNIDAPKTAKTTKIASNKEGGSKKMSHAEIIATADFEQKVLESKEPVMVDFFADWCGPCKMLAPTINDLASEYEGKAKVVKVNTDQSPEITEKYGIQGIPTVILFKDGQPIERTVGAQPKNALERMLDRAIGE